MCRLCSQPGAVCVYASVCSGVQCVSVSGSGPAPAPLSLCVFVCADLFQQFSFGQALGASSLSAPVWTQKPLTTFDSVNILAPFNMQPELLCKDEEWGEGGVWWEGREGEGLGMRGVVGVERKCSWNLTLMGWEASEWQKPEWKKKWPSNLTEFTKLSLFYVFFSVFVTNSSSGTRRPVDCTFSSLATITHSKQVLWVSIHAKSWWFVGVLLLNTHKVAIKNVA